MNAGTPSPLAPGLILGADVQLGQRVAIGAHVVIHDGAIIGDDCTLEDGVVVGKPPRLAPQSRATAPRGEAVVVASGVSLCSYAIVCQGARISAGAVIGDHAFVRERASIGADTVIGQGCAIGRGVSVGSRVRLRNNVIVAPFSTIEDDVFFGPLVAVVDDPTMGRDLGVTLRGITARRACRVGASAVLLPGVEIGIEAIVGAGAVVTRSVPERMMVMGVPARVVGPGDPT